MEAEATPLLPESADTDPLLGDHSDNQSDAGDSTDGMLSDEDEDECRVCRGPVEEGRPLFAPCRCSGSIGFVHQDCLTEWLAVTRGTKCELCTTAFVFAPKYAEGAPDKLPLYEVMAGILHQGFERWLPFLLRVMLAIALWLCVLPLATAYLYYGWIHRPSSIISRLKLDLLAGDAVSGAIVASVIIVSFLSLMSFADFLRFHWQQVNQQMQQQIQQDEHNDDVGGDFGNVLDDDELLERRNHRRLHRPENADLQPEPLRGAAVEGADAGMERLEPDVERRFFLPREGGEVVNNQDQVNQRGILANNDRERFRGIPEEEEDGHDGEEFNVPQPPPERDGQLPAGPQRRADIQNNVRFEPQFEPVEPILEQDDGMDMEIHVALDELLGFRGPLPALIRNLIWLLAFNTTYLGLFAFIPHTVGESVYNACANSTVVNTIIDYVPNQDEVVQVITALNDESQRQNVALQLPDVATIALGYFSMAFMVFFWQAIATVIFKVFKLNDRHSSNHNNQNHDHDPFMADNAENLEENEVRPTLASRFSVALECAAAIVKVGVLLFFKMLLLPLLLGVGLDVTTLSLFDSNINSRVLYAGGDLFSALLLHWVIGITFMLLVTVSVLQLREVVHPDLLARVIRPQEPQPDLLGNLLLESGPTHAKRMLLSLGIYVVLLTVHVWLPSRFLVAVGLNNLVPFFRPKLWHILIPQLQVPIELLVFHLSMLAFLEKYKNHIGELQHHWLVFMCDKMGLTDFILPHNIASFVLVGTRRVCLTVSSDDQVQLSNGSNAESLLMNGNSVKEADVDQGKPGLLGDTDLPSDASTQPTSLAKIDQFWIKLANDSNSSDEFILSNLETVAEINSPVREIGVTKRNGQRVLSFSQPNIRFPSPCKTVIPSTLGAYRLRRRCENRYEEGSDVNETTIIEFWREDVGQTIPRPPEGWDDLGVGGAETQGRWAWGNERKSEIEEGVAQRSPFYQGGKLYSLILKMIFLLLLSWVAILAVICLAISCPLLIGRGIFFLLHIPDIYVHDPAALAIGACVLVPAISKICERLSDGGALSCWEQLKGWASHFRRPKSTTKIRILMTTAFLWLFLSPLLVGLIFDLNFVRSKSWWAGNETATVQEVMKSWCTGLMFIHLWCAVCFFDIFKKEFWAGIGVLFGGNVADDNADNNGVAAAADSEVDNQVDVTRKKWEGKDGRIGQFTKTSKAVLFNWEWDKVDQVILLDDFAIPVARQVFIGISVPSILFFICLCTTSVITKYSSITSASGGFVSLLGFEDGLYRMTLYRTFSAIIISIQLAKSFSAPLNCWFKAAHKAARDDRYLIGKTLKDYER